MNLVTPPEDNSLILNNRSTVSIAVLGLGYVGLPLAVEFGKKYPTIGFDINTQRINELLQRIDATGELIF